MNTVILQYSIYIYLVSSFKWLSTPFSENMLVLENNIVNGFET